MKVYGQPRIIVKCPRCRKKIDHLNCYTYDLNMAKVKFTNEGSLKYYEQDNEWNTSPNNEIEYVCPKCGEVLFREEHEVKRFLKNSRRVKQRFHKN